MSLITSLKSSSSRMSIPVEEATLAPSEEKEKRGGNKRGLTQQKGTGTKGYEVLFTCVCEHTHGVDGDPVDASVLCLELLEENSHTVAERLEGELAALSSGRQTD